MSRRKKKKKINPIDEINASKDEKLINHPQPINQPTHLLPINKPILPPHTPKPLFTKTHTLTAHALPSRPPASRPPTPPSAPYHTKPRTCESLPRTNPPPPPPHRPRPSYPEEHSSFPAGGRSLCRTVRVERQPCRAIGTLASAEP